MRSAEASPLPIWRSCVASPPATAPTRYADGKSEVRADRRANSFAYWRWQAIDIRSLKISTSSTASISTRKTGRRAEKPSARICATRSAAALAEPSSARSGRLCLHRASCSASCSCRHSTALPGPRRITRLARIDIDHAQLNSMRPNVAVHAWINCNISGKPHLRRRHGKMFLSKRLGAGRLRPHLALIKASVSMRNPSSINRLGTRSL